MMRNQIIPGAAALALATAALLSLSCASNPDATATVDAMGKFGVEMAKGKDAIDDTLRKLDALTASTGEGVKGRLQEYSKSCDALDKQATVVREHADKMKSEGDAYFKEWEGNKNYSSERHTELMSSYAKIKDDMAAARDQFKPFLASLKDVESYLKLDPTPTGVQSVATVAKRAKDEGVQVKARIDAVLNQVNSVRGMLSAKSR
jgi:hypothetical protein